MDNLQVLKERKSKLFASIIVGFYKGHCTKKQAIQRYQACEKQYQIALKIYSHAEYIKDVNE